MNYEPEYYVDLEWESEDLGKTTFRKYFHALLDTLLCEQEGFSGKRPFGDSGWYRDMQYGCCQIKIISGIYDSEYREWQFDEDESHEAIAQMLNYVMGVK